MKLKINHTFWRISFLNQGLLMLVCGVVLLVFEILVSWMVNSPAISANKVLVLELLPPVFKKFLGEEALSFFTPLGMMSLGFTHPFVYVIFTLLPATLFGREIASAVEKGLLQFILSRPVSRGELLFSLVTFFVLCLLSFGIAIFLGLIISVLIFPEMPGLWIFVPVILNLMLLFFFFGGLALLFAVAAKSFSQALSWIIGIPLMFFVLEFLGRTIPLFEKLLFINPYHYYRPQSILVSGAFPLRNYLILFISGLVLYLISIAKFYHRDI